MIGQALDDDANSERKFEERAAQLQRRRAERFGVKARVWLALLPAWTDVLAKACDFPSGSLSPEEFAREAARANLCAFEDMPSDDGESRVVHFWATDEARAWQLRVLREEESTRPTLLEETLNLSRGVQKAVAKGVPVSPLVRCWASLAASMPSFAAQKLINTITELVSKGETGEAQTWVAAAKSLVNALGGPLESAVRVGDNLIEREYRRVQDEKYLKRFKTIPEQIEVFQRLMKTAKADGDPRLKEPWALHYVGHGGVGKTMLLRHITGRLLVEDKERPKLFSRIDFDYLSPDYPMRRPGQLLQELAAGLRAQITSSEQDAAYATFQNIALELHEALSEEPPPEEPLANIRRDEFNQTLKAFNDFLITLPQPVVLLLDTCEELAKVQTAGGRMPTVEATLEILKRVHDKVPLVRVVFAGRRLLAKAGYDWSVGEEELTDARKNLPERQDYLLLHDIRGFNKQQAEEYLRCNEGLSLADDLREAVLDKSVDKGRRSPVQREPPRPDASEDSYSPFYLSLYAQWIKDDPDVEAGDISAGKVDPYVEIRIVNRVSEGVREVLPAAVLLRRFDKEMLGVALASPERLDEVYQELSGQEWINYQWDEELQTNFLEVDRNLHDRLQEYYENSKDSYLLDQAKKEIGPGLVRLVRQRKTRHLTVEPLDALLRLLPETEAAEVWGDYELRVAEEGTWGRALRVTERILSEEGAVKSRSHPLRAAVLATRASATLHVMPELPLEQLWSEVASANHLRPDREVEVWLWRRAVAGWLVSLSPKEMVEVFTGTRGLLPVVAQVAEELRGRVPEGAARKRTEQSFASFCAVYEAYVELLDTNEGGYFPSDTIKEQLKNIRLYLKDFEKTRDAFPSEGRDVEVAAFCASLQGRLEALGQNWDEAAARLDEAATMAAGMDEGEPNRQRWLDWRAPASLRDRLRLERLRCIPAGQGAWPPRETILKWQSEAAGRLGNIDSERLVSLIIRRRLAEGLVPEEELRDILAREKYDPNRQPWRAAHGAAPPLLCTLALGWLALGDGARGLALATARIEEASGTRVDKATVRAAEAVKLHIIRRLRLPRKGTDVINRLARSTDPRDVLAVRELIAVNGSFNPDALLQPTESASASVIHAWWRSQATLTREAADYAVDRLNKLAGRRLKDWALTSQTISPDPDWSHLLLDWGEATRVAKYFKVSGLLPALALRFNPVDWWMSNPTRPEDALRLILRYYALSNEYDPTRGLGDTFGNRLRAEIALEEGELLALRLPSEACQLLNLARHWFEECGDYGGATIAATRRCIASLHMGFVPGLGDLGVYNKLAASDSTLPDWSELDALSSKPSTESLARLNHPTWQGWLHRLSSMLAFSPGLRFSYDPDKHWEQWRKLLQGVYGQRLPVELLLSRAHLERRETTASPVPPFFRILFRYWLKAAGFPFLIFLFLVGGLFIGRGGPFREIYAGVAGLSLVAYVKWMKKGLTPFQAVTYLGLATGIFAVVAALAFYLRSLFAEIGLIDLVFIAVVVVAISLFLWWYARRLNDVAEALRVATFGASLHILPGEDEGEAAPEMFGPRSVRMIFRRSYFASKWLPLKRAEEVHEGAGRVEGLEPYRQAMKMMPLEVSDELFRLNQLLRKGPAAASKLRVALEVDPALAHYPWEAMLSLAAAGKDEPLSRIKFWRAGEPFTGRNSVKYDKKIFVVVSRIWEMMAVRGWSKLTATRGWLRPSRMKIRTGSFPNVAPTEALRVLHLIGTPARLSAGLRLKISEPPAGGAESRAAQVIQPGGIAAAQYDDGVYVGTENLPLERSALVVVQGEPSEFSERQQTQREQTARLRAFAADVFAAGAHRVVLLPSLPAAVAEEVLRQLGKDLRAGDQPILLFLETIERMGNVILKGYEAQVADGDPAAETRLELALDICVFTRDASSLLQTSKDKPT
jgi:hypothetical protein